MRNKVEYQIVKSNGKLSTIKTIYVPNKKDVIAFIGARHPLKSFVYKGKTYTPKRVEA